MTVTQRVALVTGAGRGIGAAIATRLHEAGYDVALADIDEAAVTGLAQQLGPTGRWALPLRLDVSDAASRSEAVAATTGSFGRLDVLVNCAGILRDARVENVTADGLDRLLAVNLVGPLSLIRLAADPLSVNGGAIVNIASRAWLGIFGSTMYSMSKGGLVGATRALALELGPRGITVNAVAPGYVETEMSLGLPKKVLDRTLASIAVGRGGRPDDIADLVEHLASRAGYTTGQVILACGGRSIGLPADPTP